MAGSSIIHELGDPDGFAVVLHNGTPCSRLLPGWWDVPARERGLRLIGIDRAGYGNAPAEPNRSLRSVAEATGALMDDLGSTGSPSSACPAAAGTRLPAARSCPSGWWRSSQAPGSSGFDEAIDGAGFDPEELELTREQALRPTPEGRQAAGALLRPRGREPAQR